MLGRTLRAIEARLGRRVFVWSGALLALSLILSAIPLFDLLGYDFSFAVGMLTALAAVDVGHGAVAAARRARAPIGLLRLSARALAGVCAMLVPPLLVSLLNALRVKNCNLLSGLAFYALLPLGTALYAAVGGVVAALVAPRRGRLLAFALPVLSVLWSLVRLYRDPAVFAFDPFGGYFPGPIYDEALRPPVRLLWFRLCNLVWAGAALALVGAFSAGGRATQDGPPRPMRRPPEWSWRWVGLAGALTIAAVVLFQVRGPLGFHVRHRELYQALGRRTESVHFVVYSDPAAGTPEDLQLVHRDLEFRYQQLVRILGTEPGRVTVFQFPSAGAKKELVGAGNTLYAKPWQREIFVQSDRFPAGHLRHELAHVFAAGFGDRIFGVAFAWHFWGPFPVPRLASGLIEGVAEAADYGDPDGRATIHQEARAMMADGRAPPIRGVVGAGFSALAGARAYTLAGSFCHFLLLEGGPQRLRALYRSAGDFAGVYGQPLEALEARWHTFLERQPLEAAERARAQERFRRPAIFQKVCARELAARVADARGRMYSAPDRAIALLESACLDDPGEPTFRLDLADALFAAGRPAEALATASQVEKTAGMTWPLRARAAALQASIHFHAGRFSDAEAAVRRALEVATEEGEERTAHAKLRALADPAARATLGRVLFGDAPNRAPDAAVSLYLIGEFARLFSDEALGPYLLARQLAWRDPHLALPLIARACGNASPAAGRIPLPPLFARECLRMTGETAFRAEDFPRSRAAYQRLRDEAPNEAERLRANDFLERIAWEEARRRT
jgi:tetratricopeptide (TPR) repeat protein